MPPCPGGPTSTGVSGSAGSQRFHGRSDLGAARGRAAILQPSLVPVVDGAQGAPHCGVALEAGAEGDLGWDGWVRGVGCRYEEGSAPCPAPPPSRSSGPAPATRARRGAPPAWSQCWTARTCCTGGSIGGRGVSQHGWAAGPGVLLNPAAAAASPPRPAPPPIRSPHQIELDEMFP